MHRRGGGGLNSSTAQKEETDLPLHSASTNNTTNTTNGTTKRSLFSPSKKTSRKGGSTSLKKNKPLSYRRTKQITRILKYLSYTIFILIIILVLLLRFDNVKVVLKNRAPRIFGNTQHYGDHPRSLSLFRKNNYENNNNNGKDEESGGPINGYYVVFCTVSNMESTYVGKGKSKESGKMALRDAQSKLPRKSNNYPYVKIDIVTGVKRFENYNYFDELNGDWFGLSLGANWEESDWNFLPEEVYANSLVDKNKFIRWERIGLYAAKSGRSEGAYSLPDFSDDGTVMDVVDLFRTQSVLLDRYAKEVVVVFDTTTTTTINTNIVEADGYSLYHGHQLYDSSSSFDSKFLLNRAKEAGTYLATQAVKDQSGRQVYKYHPRSDYEPLLGGYNMARHAGTLYSMAMLYRQEKQPRLQDSMALTLRYLLSTIQDCPIPNQEQHDKNTNMVKCSVEHETKKATKISKLGVNAMAIIAICEYVDAVRPSSEVTNDLLNLVYQLVQYLQGSWLSTNSFSEGDSMNEQFIHKIQLDKESNKLVAIDLDYYVRSHYGEVSFALARMLTLAKNNKWTVLLNDQKEWLDLANKVALFIITKDRQEEIKKQQEQEKSVDDNEEVMNAATFIFDHWLLNAIAALDVIDPNQHIYDKLFYEYARRSVSTAHKWQTTEEAHDKGEDNDDLDQMGVYYDDLSSTMTAITSEGLCAILPYLQKRQQQNGKEFQLAFHSAMLALQYQLQTQYRPETAMYMRDPKRILGGFASSIQDTQMRIDATSHNLSSILCMALQAEAAKK